MNKENQHKSKYGLYWLIIILFFVYGISPVMVFAQHKRKATKKASVAASIKYHNIFKEAGYKQADIDAKVERAYKDLFESPAGIYFEVGDSMAYVSDLKNNDARSEGLSYGMMVAVQLNKKNVLLQEIIDFLKRR